MNEFVNIATFNHKPEAEALKSMLLSKGVTAEVQDETNLQKYWFWATTKAGIHVQVTKEYLANTQELLSQPEATHLLQKAIRCPSCNSLQVQYPDLTRKNILPTLLAQLFVLLRFTQHKYYCESCHFSWLKAPVRAYERKRARTSVS
ncbi:MAG: hypothetical protein JWR69_4203 [Pedosphaera sp.]|nr:hypothetical protein [Pedosphaera sp.]